MYSGSVFSERELTFTFAVCRRLSVCMSVCRLSVTFVRTTEAIKIFGHVSMPFGTMAISWHPGKILWRSSQELNTTGVAEYSDFGHFESYISERCKTGTKLVLLTNRKSQTSFRLVPKSVTLDDLERRNDRYFALLRCVRHIRKRTTRQTVVCI